LIGSSEGRGLLTGVEGRTDKSKAILHELDRFSLQRMYDKITTPVIF